MSKNELIAQGGNRETSNAVDLIVETLSANLKAHVGQETHYGRFGIEIEYFAGQIRSVQRSDAVRVLFKK